MEHGRLVKNMKSETEGKRKAQENLNSANGRDKYQNKESKGIGKNG